MSRPRSSTASSFASSLRSEASRAPVSNAAAPLTLDTHPSSQESNRTAQALNEWAEHGHSEGMGTSYASQHTLKTIRGRGDSGSDDEAERLHEQAEDDPGPPDIRRGNPQFILDLAPGSPATGKDKLGRARSETFGGVPLPPSPAAPNSFVTAPPSADQSRPHRPIPRRAVSDSSLRSIPSSLHLGGGTFAERRPMLHAGLKAGALFGASLLGIWLLLRTLLPPIDEEHKALVKLPKSFEELKGLNEVLQIYKTRHWWRVFGSYTTVYLFLQAFSIPGSMYMSMLGGAMYGVVMALPLVCFCVATGALFCYYISAALGPAILLNSEKWQRRVDAWSARIDGHKENLISYLIVLRIAPLPPHWVVNVVAPHLGISIWPFWCSTFLGIAGVSYIHTTIGTTLDQMTSSNDFHLISWQNGLGLGGIVVAVLVPVALRRMWKKDLEQAAEDPADEAAEGRVSLSIDRDPLLGGLGTSSSLSPAASTLDLSPSGGKYVDDEERNAGGWGNGHAKGAEARPFRLDSSDDDDSEGEAELKGKSKAPEGSQGEWNESSLDRSRAKASKVLGVNVGRDMGGPRR